MDFARFAADLLDSSSRCRSATPCDRGAARSQAAGRGRRLQSRILLRRQELCPDALARNPQASSRTMKRKYLSRTRDIGRISAEGLAQKPIDLNLKWPAAVKATIAQGEEAFRRL